MDMMKGYAMIVGTKDTPYFGGYYLFEITFPTDYPYSPPRLNYITNDGRIRFNPNLYINGKVCISILNTWHGEQWSSCQTISSVLLTLCTVLNKSPLLNEPGLTIHHPEINKYNQIIEFSNISIAICDLINKKISCSCADIFYSEMTALFLKNYNDILQFIENKIEKTSSETNNIVSVGFYNLIVVLDYQSLKDKFIECKSFIENMNNNTNTIINKIEIKI